MMSGGIVSCAKGNDGPYEFNERRHTSPVATKVDVVKYQGEESCPVVSCNALSTAQTTLRYGYWVVASL